MNRPVIAGLIVLLTATGCNRAPPSSFQGYVEGEFVYVATSQPGQLQRLNVVRGQLIESGTPLFVLDAANEAAGERAARERLAAAEARLADLKAGDRPEDLAILRAQLEQARAEATRASAQLNRDKEIFPTGAIPRSRLDDSRAAADSAAARVREIQDRLTVGAMGSRNAQIQAQEAEVGAARAILEQATWTLEQKAIKSTSAGLVFDTIYREGEWVPAGSPVVRMLPTGKVKVRFFVPEPSLGKLATGQPVVVRCDGCAKPVSAAITYISTEAEYTPPIIFSNDSRAKLSYLIEARPAASDSALLHPGQPVEVVLQ